MQRPLLGLHPGCLSLHGTHCHCHSHSQAYHAYLSHSHPNLSVPSSTTSPAPFPPSCVIYELIQSFLVTYHFSISSRSFSFFFFWWCFNPKHAMTMIEKLIRVTVQKHFMPAEATVSDLKIPPSQFTARGDKCMLVCSAAWGSKGRVFFSASSPHVPSLEACECQFCSLCPQYKMWRQLVFFFCKVWNEKSTEYKLFLRYRMAVYSEIKLSQPPQKREQPAPADTPEWQLWILC